MALIRSLCLAVVFSTAFASSASSRATSRATAWLAQHNGHPSADALNSLRSADPNSYALVQQLLSSPSVIMTLEHSEAKAMDSPVRRLRPRRGVFAGLQQQKQQHRKTISQQQSFQEIVESAAGAAEDQSKLSWDFGEAATPPQVSPRGQPVFAQQQEQDPKAVSQPIVHETNALLQDAEDVKNSDDLPAPVGAASPVNRRKQPVANPYSKWLS